MRLEELEGKIFVLTLQETKNQKGEFENRFNQEIVDEINKKLDDCLARKARVLVLTGGENKFFSNGHDIEWLGQAVNKENGLEAQEFINSFYRLLARFLVLPIPTIAAVNGHAFAGGCLLAMAQDYRVMNINRGFICMNEIDMVPEKDSPNSTAIQPGIFPGADYKMTAVLQSKISSKTTLRDMYLQGLRFDGKLAKEYGIVDIASSDHFKDAIELAKKLAMKAHDKNRRTIAVLKYESSRNYVNILVDGTAEQFVQNQVMSRF